MVSCAPTSRSAVRGLEGSFSKNANTLIAFDDFWVALEPVDWPRAIGGGAACSLLCPRVVLAFAALRDRETDSGVIVKPLPLEPPEDAVMPGKSDTRDDTAVSLALDRRPLRSGFVRRDELNMLALV